MLQDSNAVLASLASGQAGGSAAGAFKRLSVVCGSSSYVCTVANDTIYVVKI